MWRRRWQGSAPWRADWTLVVLLAASAVVSGAAIYGAVMLVRDLVVVLS